MTNQQLERLAHWTPAFVVFYFLAQFVIRVALSANLETDEAELVRHAAFSFYTENGHPPLYNWLVAALHPLTGGHWATTFAIVKNLLLAGSYLLAFDLMRRVTGKALPGLMTVCAFLLLPQIVWKSQITLTHSVLATFAIIAVLHAVVLIVQRGSNAAFIWLGFALATGGLAKYNFFIALFGLAVGALTLPPIADKIYSLKLRFSVAIFVLLFSPYAVWSVTNWENITRRIEKLEDADKSVTNLDIPFLGIDGLLTIATGTLAWAALLVVIWLAIWHFCKSPKPYPAPQEEGVGNFKDLLSRALVISFSTFALIVLLADFHTAQERYLTPILIFLPFWLVLAFPLQQTFEGARYMASLAGIIVFAMLTAWPIWALTGREQLFFPYQEMAESLKQELPPAAVLLASKTKYAVNLSLYLPQFKIWSPSVKAHEIALLWHDDETAPPAKLLPKLGDLYEPSGRAIAVKHPYTNFSGAEAVLSYQIYRRRMGQ